MIELLTNQEAFDIVFNGLRGQGFRQSLRAAPYDGCAYRGFDSEGNPAKCAAGHLIADEDYFDYMEGKGTGVSLVSNKIPVLDNRFLCTIQAIHDINNNPQQMEAALRRFATREKLKVPKEGTTHKETA